MTWWLLKPWSWVSQQSQLDTERCWSSVLVGASEAWCPQKVAVVATGMSAQQEAEAGGGGGGGALSSHLLISKWWTGTQLEVGLPLSVNPQRHAQCCVSSMIPGSVELRIRLATTGWKRMIGMFSITTPPPLASPLLLGFSV